MSVKNSNLDKSSVSFSISKEMYDTIKGSLRDRSDFDLAYSVLDRSDNVSLESLDKLVLASVYVRMIEFGISDKKDLVRKISVEDCIINISDNELGEDIIFNVKVYRNKKI